MCLLDTKDAVQGKARSCVRREDDVKLCGLFRFKPFYKTIEIFDINNRELIEFQSNWFFN